MNFQAMLESVLDDQHGGGGGVENSNGWYVYCALALFAVASVNVASGC